jgi:hypothetical protein
VERFEKLVEISVRYVPSAFCVVTERFEIAVEREICVTEKFEPEMVDSKFHDVESPTCSAEKFEPEVVESKSHDDEMPLVVRKPTELIPAVRVEVTVENVEPVFVLRFDSSVVV